ncbi:hypothetical protein KVH27_35570 [Streptomyces olivaceus]|uniref:hypothetical protein n=1 Tax=Streptomyces olivaceus TaxID=47716 RepID=UPI001CCCA268|nr:hypothetical protein [Streptomyces olivaceus]MBZ6253671.1 hypothetical protein [Streptomyces olivaceus]
MITATQRANAMALQVFIAAHLHNGRVITHDLVDAVMSRDAGTEQGAANKEQVRRIIRKRAELERVRVIFTEDERYWAIREQLHHMRADEVHALRDEITEGGDRDPRGWDKALTNAVSVRLSNRPTPARLYGCKPVSVRLWREPRPESAPVATSPADDRKHVRIVDGGTPQVIPTRDALDEMNHAMMSGQHNVREMTHARSRARIVYKDRERGTVELRPATPEDLASAPAPATGRDATPLFTALAAYEACGFGRTPRDLADLIRHLLTLRKVSPPEHHRAVVDAQIAVDDAWEALRTAHSLTTRNAAHEAARAAIEQARAAILAVAPHARRMHGTNMPATAEEIRAAVLAYNAAEGAPEELSAAAAGTPVIRVHCRSDSGTGWTATAVITAGMDSSVGHIPAHPPIVVEFRKRDGRQDAAENARRILGPRFSVAVPVDYVLDRRP